MNYNYQIHQIFYSLEQVLSWWHEWPDTRYLPARLKVPERELKVVHVSGDTKPWDRAYSEETGTPVDTVVQFADQILQDCAHQSYGLWVQRKAPSALYSQYNVELDDVSGRFISTKREETEVNSELQVETLIANAVKIAKDVCERAVEEWHRGLESWLVDTGRKGSIVEFLRDLRKIPGSDFWVGQAVHVLWQPTEKYLRGNVSKVHVDLRVDVFVTDPEWYGVYMYNLNPAILCAVSHKRRDEDGEEPRACVPTPERECSQPRPRNHGA